MTGIDHYDWSPLGGNNPVPGDPDTVRAMADKFSDLSSTVGVQNRLLRGVSGQTSEVWTGEAANGFHEQVGPLPGYLDKLIRSYDEAASALHEYWPRLRDAQDQAVQALAKARTAQQTVGDAQTKLTSLQGQAQAAGETYNRLANPSAFVTLAQPQPKLSPAQQQAHQAQLNQAQAHYQGLQSQVSTVQYQVSTAQSQLADAKTQCANAVGAAKAAASHCATRLKEASKAGIQNPHHSWFGSIVSDVVGVAKHAWDDTTNWVDHEVSDVTNVAETAWHDTTTWVDHEASNVVNTAETAWHDTTTWVDHEASNVVNTAETAWHDTTNWVDHEAAEVANIAATAWHDTEHAWDSTTSWVAHHASDIEFAASLALGPAGLFLTAKGRHLAHEALEKAEPYLKVTSEVLSVATGVLGVASLVLAPFGVGEVLDGVNEVLMAAKTADDGLLVAAGDKEAEGELVADGIGLATLGVGDAFEAATSTMKAGAEVAEKTEGLAEAGENVTKASQAAEKAGEDLNDAIGTYGRANKVLQNASGALRSRAEQVWETMGNRLDGAVVNKVGADNALTDAKAAQQDATDGLASAKDELATNKANFDLSSPKSYVENALGKTTLQKGWKFVTDNKTTMTQFRDETGMTQETSLAGHFPKYYKSYFSGPKAVVTLRAAKTAYFTYDSSTFVMKEAGGPKIAVPDLAGSLVGGEAGG